MGAEIIITNQGPSTWVLKLSSHVRALDMGAEIINAGQGPRPGGVYLIPL